MKLIGLLFLLMHSIIAFSQNGKAGFIGVEAFKNRWTEAPKHIPNDVSIDAPLMGNGNVTMSVGSKENCLRYYLSKNDFWRLRSQGNRLSGPRVVGFLEIKIEGFSDAGFIAEQVIRNGVTTCVLNKKNQKLETRSWVSATENLVFIEIKAIDNVAKLSINLTAPGNSQARLNTGKKNNISWLTRDFVDSVDIATGVAVALKILSRPNDTIVLQPGEKVLLALAIESRFKNNDPLGYALNRIEKINQQSIASIRRQHDKWWNSYWNKSSVSVEDSVLMKAYYQGLYTMAACSRDERFPPGIFGWTSTDTPAWNGDYHLNYNFQAPFYGLYAANRLEQAEPHDAPLLDFMPRGQWYAKNVTNTRGILFPVGIGPIGIEVTRNYTIGGYQKKEDIEQGGLFYGQRSNASYGLINMAQHWRRTYDEEYGKKIYSYALAIADFWEDYLKFEDGRYVIYGDAIHEGAGKDKNSILSLGLIRNALELIIDLSATLKRDQHRKTKWEHILNHLSEFPQQVRNGKTVFRYTEEGVAWWNDNGLGIQHIYPAEAISLDSKEELLSVARNTIGEMQRWQDYNTGSSFFMAAIRVGYDSSVIMNELHKYAVHTYPNGFQLNNPHGIENSCVVANALDEMLCMSVGNTIRLFVGFPGNQSAGFKDIRARGAFLVSARLTNGVVSNLHIKSEKGKDFTLVNPWPGKRMLLSRNGKVAETISGTRVAFRTSSSEIIELNAL